MDDDADALSYEEGTRCIILASGDETNYESIVFADINEDGRISRLVASTNSRYHFRIDEKKRSKTILDDVVLPGSVAEPIILRARFHGIINEDVTEDQILRELDCAKIYEDNVRQMLADLPEGDEKTNLKNLFGYLFAKAIESEYSEKNLVDLFKNRLIVNYTPSDAWNGEIGTFLKPEQHKKIVAAMELGKQFAKDFALFHPFEAPHGDVYKRQVRHTGELHQGVHQVPRLIPFAAAQPSGKDPRLFASEIKNFDSGRKWYGVQIGQHGRVPGDRLFGDILDGYLLQRDPQVLGQNSGRAHAASVRRRLAGHGDGAGRVPVPRGRTGHLRGRGPGRWQIPLSDRGAL